MPRTEISSIGNKETQIEVKYKNNQLVDSGRGNEGENRELLCFVANFVESFDFLNCTCITLIFERD